MASPPLRSINDESSLAETLSVYSLSHLEFTTLCRLATDAKALAYCPYSHFRVGAALLVAGSGSDKPSTSFPADITSPPTCITGANIENASYPVGMCAERTAISRAVVEGHRRFRAVAVATDISPPASPCGMCRQFIREFCDTKTPIIMFDKNLDYVVMTLEQLLPMSFGPDVLPPPEAMLAARTKMHGS